MKRLEIKTPKYPKIKLGTVNGDPIFLTPPSWNCGWYWGFGYLGNKDTHYHIDGLNKGKNINMYDAFLNHFDTNTLVVNDNELWVLCELFESFYILKNTAEFYKTGSANYTNNPICHILKNEVQYEEINTILLPAIFEQIYKILCNINN